MAEELFTNVAGTWKPVAQPFVNVSGTWRSVSDVWVNIGGTWRHSWPAPGGGGGFVNTPPVVAAPIPDQTATINAAFSYQLPAGTFTDADDHALTYSATGVPAGLTFTPATRTIAGTPTTLGAFSVTITASDSFGGSVSDVFVVAVSAAGYGGDITFYSSGSPVGPDFVQDGTFANSGSRQAFYGAGLSGGRMLWHPSLNPTGYNASAAKPYLSASPSGATGYAEPSCILSAHIPFGEMLSSTYLGPDTAYTYKVYPPVPPVGYSVKIRGYLSHPVDGFGPLSAGLQTMHATDLGTVLTVQGDRSLKNGSRAWTMVSRNQYYEGGFGQFQEAVWFETIMLVPASWPAGSTWQIASGETLIRLT